MILFIDHTLTESYNTRIAPASHLMPWFKSGEHSLSRDQDLKDKWWILFGNMMCLEDDLPALIFLRCDEMCFLSTWMIFRVPYQVCKSWFPYRSHGVWCSPLLVSLRWTFWRRTWWILLTRSQPARWIQQSLGLIDTYWGLIGTNWGRLLGNCGLGSLGFSCYFMSGG